MDSTVTKSHNYAPPGMRFKGRYSNIGLDLGSSRIKLVQLKKKRGRVHLHQYGIYPLPEGSVEGGRLADPTAIAEKLRWIIRRRRLHKNRINMCVSSQTIVLRQIQLPRMPPRDVPAALRWEAEKQVMIPLDEAVLDYIDLGERVVEGQTVMEMALVAVPKEVVNGYTEVALRADLYPEVIEIEPFALQRVIPYFQDGAGLAAEAVMVLDLGGESSNLVVVEKNNFSFARTLNIGANHFCRQVAGLRGGNFATAQRLVFGGEPFAVEGVQEVADELVGQIRRSLEFFIHNTDYERKEIRSLYLCGGGFFIDRLASFLGFELKVEPKLLNPFSFIHSGRRFIRADLEQEGHLLNVAVGLALRGWQV